MDVSIIILNYKSTRLVRQCLKTIRLLAPQVRHEVIVVDNGSGDDCGAAVAREYPSARFIDAQANLGFAAGNNLGIRQAQGRHLLLLNPDITIRPGSVEALVDYMDREPTVGVAGPRLVKGNGESDESCFRYPSPWTPICRRTPLGQTRFGRRELDRYLITDYDRRSTRDVDWVLGAAMMVRRRALDQVGPLDERYFLYFEDADWCRSFQAAGWRVSHFADAEMVHYHEKESAKGNPLLALRKPAFRAHIHSCLKYFRKWGWDTPPSVS
jgi:GT2 family glycosyltransferase